MVSLHWNILTRWSRESQLLACYCSLFIMKIGTNRRPCSVVTVLQFAFIGWCSSHQPNISTSAYCKTIVIISIHQLKVSINRQKSELSHSYIQYVHVRIYLFVAVSYTIIQPGHLSYTMMMMTHCTYCNQWERCYWKNMSSGRCQCMAMIHSTGHCCTALLIL